MRQALLILRKDVRHLWPQIAVFWALVAGYAYLDAATPGNPKLALSIAMPTLALMGACFYLIGVLIHEDAPLGDRQFWVTRPFDWRGLLAAKVLFVTVFMALPVFAAQVVTVAVNGLPVASTLAALISKQESLLILLTVAVAFSAVTRNLTQFFLAVLVACISQWLLVAFIISLAYENGDWGSVGWIRGASMALLLLPGIVALLVLSYWRRAETLSRCLVAVLMLLASVFLCWDWWHAAWDVQTRLYGNPATAPPVSIAFDASATPPAKGRWYHHSRDNVVGLRIPVQVGGIPGGMQLVGERLRTRVEVPGGRVWDSGWRAVGGIGAVDGGPHIVRRDGADFLAVTIDTAFYDEIKNAPAHVQTRLAFTVLGKPEVAWLRLGAPVQRVSKGCFCSLPDSSDSSVWCASMEGDNARREIYWESPEKVSAGGIWVPWGVFQTFAVRQYRRGYTPSSPSTGSVATVLTRRAENYIEVDLDIPAIRLGVYEVGRSRGPRMFLENLRIE